MAHTHTDSHILAPSPYFRGQLQTLDGKYVTIRRGAICTEVQCQPIKRAPHPYQHVASNPLCASHTIMPQTKVSEEGSRFSKALEVPIVREEVVYNDGTSSHLLQCSICCTSTTTDDRVHTTITSPSHRHGFLPSTAYREAAGGTNKGTHYAAARLTNATPNPPCSLAP